MESNQLINALTLLLGIMVSILFILCVIFVVLKFREKKPKNKKEKNKEKNTQATKTANIIQSYNKESIFKFMEFDKIEDNLIVQKDGKRFLMVIECQGINYDLMSGLEKNSVEQGFLQFLNTL